MIRKRIRVCRWVSSPWEVSSVTTRVLLGETPRLPLAKPWAPLLDICEQKKRIVVRAELPGVEPRQVTLLVHHNRLELRGEKTQEVHSEPARYLRLERESGPFRRVVALPGAILPEKTKAVMDNGVLTIVLVKADAEDSP
jgi:HSP20 family protein